MIGHFGQSFDDLIKMLVEEHNELMRVKGQSQKITQFQSKGEARPNTMVDRMYETEEELRELHEKVEKYHAGGKITVYLSGLKYPTDKNKILEIARKNESNIDPVIEGFHKIPNRTYKNQKDLLDTFTKVYHDLGQAAIKEAMKELGPMSQKRSQLETISMINPTMEISIK